MLVIGGITKVSPNETGGVTVDVENLGMDLYVPAEVVEECGELLVVGAQLALVDWIDPTPWLEW